MERIICVSGKIASGKTTLASLIELYNPYARRALAGALKADLARLCQVSVDYIEENKELFRPMLQYYGTEIMRKVHGEDYWVRRLVQDSEDAGLSGLVVDDVRFPNEVEGLVASARSAAFSVRLEVDPAVQAERYLAKYGSALSEDKANHVSETALDSYHHFDATFDSSHVSARAIYLSLCALRPDLFSPPSELPVRTVRAGVVSVSSKGFKMGDIVYVED